MKLRPARHPSQHRRRCVIISMISSFELYSDIPHVRRRLDGRDELESSVSDTDDTDKGTWDNTEPLLANNDGADENVN
jgi:hypothetical protein